MKTINENLVLENDTTYDEGITVKGSIFGKDGKRFNLKVKGDIDCWNISCLDIDCGNIVCRNIDCWDINCRNIDCWDIDCGDIDANFIICESIKKKTNNSKMICKNIIVCRSEYVKKEANP